MKAAIITLCIFVSVICIGSSFMILWAAPIQDTITKILSLAFALIGFIPIFTAVNILRTK